MTKAASTPRLVTSEGSAEPAKPVKPFKEPMQPMINEADKFRADMATILDRVNADLSINASERVSVEENHARELETLHRLNDARMNQLGERDDRLFRIKAGAEAALKASEAS